MTILYFWVNSSFGSHLYPKSCHECRKGITEEFVFHTYCHLSKNMISLVIPLCGFMTFINETQRKLSNV